MTEYEMLQYFSEQHQIMYEEQLDFAKQLDISKRSNKNLKEYFAYCATLGSDDRFLNSAYYAKQCYFIASEMAYRGLK